MYLTDIALDDFRSYHSQVVHLQPGVCLLVGANGQGKTNFVEAISYLTNFHSHRAAVDTALVRYQPQNAGLAEYLPVKESTDAEDETTADTDLAGASVKPPATAQVNLADETAQIGDETSALEKTPVADESVEASQVRSTPLPSYPATAVESAPTCAVIRAKALINDRPTVIDLEIVAGRANRARLARNLVKPKEIKGLVRSVLFAPEDLQILKGDPALRRRFLDDLLVMVEPVQAGALSAQQKILKQRGALLKEAQKRHRRRQSWSDLEPTLSIFNEQLAGQAAQIIAGRRRLVQALQPHVEAAYRLILGEEHREHSAQCLALEYQSVAQPQTGQDPQQIYEDLMRQFSVREPDEISRGVNLVGAHRDDLLVTLDALPVKGFASQGETWTAALSLRLAQFELLNQLGETPILLLDDVFSELDQARRQALVQYMRKADQVIVTSAVIEDLPETLKAALYHVQRTAQGTVISGPEPLHGH